MLDVRYPSVHEDKVERARADDLIRNVEVAALCDMLELPGEEAREWLAIAIIENPKNASRAEWLKRALFACWVLGVGALTTQTNDAQATEADASTTASIEGGRYVSVTHPLHIVAVLAGLAGWVRKAVAALRLPAPAPSSYSRWRATAAA